MRWNPRIRRELITYHHQRPFLPPSSSSRVLIHHPAQVIKVAMSDSEDHHFESKADAGASKTYPMQAGAIRKGGFLVIKNRPCKVVEVSTSKTGKHGHAKCHFVALDIFNGKKLEDIVPSSHNCDVPHVDRTEYQLIDISEDGFVSLLTDNGSTKDDLKLPTDDAILTQDRHVASLICKKNCKDRRASLAILSKLLLSICSTPCGRPHVFGYRASPHTLPDGHASKNKGPKISKGVF
ncbi:eukaryotic translation initiation factor 5A isoform X2 [Triticum aestivum]|uniref:eukaryotic translation initiation factor 5A isoform X2 n=1 Tax=Triticum aestivum TaxID=4565 RepID=UPI001D026809|nr:eukaryotic translation initiation factor 5A-like isoform X2 [Triticum aestivum]